MDEESQNKITDLYEIISGIAVVIAVVVSMAVSFLICFLLNYPR
jgi:hypothetical protein